MKALLIALISLTVGFSALAKTTKPQEEVLPKIEEILSAYNGTESIYGRYSHKIFTPTAVEYDFSEGTVSVESVDIKKYGGIRGLLSELHKQTGYSDENSDPSYELNLQITLGYKNFAKVKEVLLKSVLPSDAKKLDKLLTSPISLAQLVVFDTSSELLGEEYIVIYTEDRALVIKWRYCQC